MIVTGKINNNQSESFIRSCILIFICSLLSVSQGRGQAGATPEKKFENIPYNIIHETRQVREAPVALLLSGDGGWFGFEQSIATKLADYGIPTIGIDIKKYLWSRKTPSKVASEMAELLNYYGKEWKKGSIILIGYSQGAEIVPFLSTRFSGMLKIKVRSIVMLSPETSTDFEIHISNMLGLGNNQNKFSVIDEIKLMPVTTALCIFGNNEKTPMPDLLKGTRVKVLFIPGDHHYKNNTTLIVKTMKDNNAF